MSKIVRNPFTWRLAYFLLGVATCLLAVTLTFFFGPVPRRILARTAAEPQYLGAWGELSAVQVRLANPNGELPDQTSRLQKPSWFFEHFTEAQLSQLLRNCSLSPVQRSILFDQRFWQVTSNGCTITPPEPVIWSLNGRARGIIYSALARCASNYAQCFPFRFPPERFEEHLLDSGLSQPEIQQIKRLAYTNAGAVCFTDLKTMHELLEPVEFEDLVGALYRVPAYTLRVLIYPDSDVDGMIRYWGKGGREKLVSPLLKALARVPGGAGINVGQLLPPFARSRLFTYPDAWNDPNAPREDCFYAAMNFFAQSPDTNFFNGDYTTKILAQEFEVMAGTATFGDRLLLVNSRGAGVHMCVYVAGDFVFTKNGINRTEPWVLMRLSDVMMIYLGPNKAGRLVIYRPKEKPESPGA